MIDSDYRAGLMVAMINLGTKAVTVARGTRMAQPVFQKVEEVWLVPVDALPPTDRGSGGFGSVGA